MTADLILEKILRSVQKPGRYIGKEVNSVLKNPETVKLRFAFCFPDVYEVAMSHLGMRIIYNLLNNRPEIWCERVFAPWFDMGKLLKQHHYPLFALESRDALSAFDVLGFTLQYELSYTNILYMLDLADIPLYASKRGDNHPLVIGGGPCVCNPEPVADFFDLFVIGEGEEVLVKLCYFLMEAKNNCYSKKKTLELASQIEGIYVPSLYSLSYGEEGLITSFIASKKAPVSVKKRVIANLNSSEYFSATPVPMLETIHDRTTLELQRGCIRGCRFCQAGFIYRPFRVKDADTLNAQAKEQCLATGYDEISLLSLSTSDYPHLERLLNMLLSWTQDERINLSLPSLRIDNFSQELIEKTTSVRKSGLTFAPEAGTQRMRDIINKNITDEQILSSCKIAFINGYEKVKLYFMIGLPGETDADVLGISELAQKIVDLYYSVDSRAKSRPIEVNVSVAYFVPKPFTPFQFVAQNRIDEIIRKQKLLLSSIRSKRITVNYHDAQTSFIEAVLARGDRRLSRVLASAYRSGSFFDSWGEGFNYCNWEKSFKKHNIHPGFYACRERTPDEIMPWDILDYGIDKAFLIKEYERAKNAATTPDCRQKCSGCGIFTLTGRECFARNQTAFQ